MLSCKDDPVWLQRLLETHSGNQQLIFINYSPLVFINEKAYKGNVSNISNLFDGVCYSYERMPKICKQVEGYKVSLLVKNNRIIKFFVFTTIFFLGVIFFFLLSFYVLMKKRMDSSYKMTLNAKIQEALSRYYEDEEMKQDAEA